MRVSTKDFDYFGNNLNFINRKILENFIIE